MSSSREESPDWLRSFQAPTRSVLTLSSGSESPLDDHDPTSDDEDQIKLSKLFKKDPQIRNDQDSDKSPACKDSEAKSLNETKNVELSRTPGRKRKRKRRDSSEQEEEKVNERIIKRKASQKPKPQEANHSIWTLSSDSESCPETDLVRKDNVHHKEYADDKPQHVEVKEDNVAVIDRGAISPHEKASTRKSPKKQLKKDEDRSAERKKENCNPVKENEGRIDVGEEETAEKQEGPKVSSSRLPVVLSEKVQHSKALVECQGDSIDLSGDMGAVGRIVIADTPPGNHDMLLDLKGTIYKTTIVPSRTFCVVSFGQSEAKIEAIMNDFIQLKPQSNVYEAETMVEGTLDGFSFDSEEEADHQPKAIDQNDKNEASEEKFKGKVKGKADKTKRATVKKAKAAGGKLPKRSMKKSQAPKKSKGRK